MGALKIVSSATRLHAMKRIGISPRRRWNSTQTPKAGEAGKPLSPHIGFYKTFTRPVAKVLLMATFTYQLAYWAWVKLEKDEIKEERSEIKDLEQKLAELTKGEKKTTTP